LRNRAIGFAPIATDEVAIIALFGTDKERRIRTGILAYRIRAAKSVTAARPKTIRPARVAIDEVAVVTLFASCRVDEPVAANCECAIGIARKRVSTGIALLVGLHDTVAANEPFVFVPVAIVVIASVPAILAERTRLPGEGLVIPVEAVGAAAGLVSEPVAVRIHAVAYEVTDSPLGLRKYRTGQSVTGINRCTECRCHAIRTYGQRQQRVRLTHRIQRGAETFPRHRQRTTSGSNADTFFNTVFVGQARNESGSIGVHKAVAIAIHGSRVANARPVRCARRIARPVDTGVRLRRSAFGSIASARTNY
jgi:hypothetical protein